MLWKWWAVPLSPHLSKKSLWHPQLCSLAHRDHMVTLHQVRSLSPVPSPLSWLDSKTQRLSVVFSFYTGPRLAAKTTFLDTDLLTSSTCLKSPSGYLCPTVIVPGPMREFQVPHILVSSSLSCHVSGHVPDEHAMSFPSQPLHRPFLSLTTFLTPQSS